MKAVFGVIFLAVFQIVATAAELSSSSLFLRGANFGNYLEAPPGQDWGAKYTEKDFINVEREGFDHVRLPIAWSHYAGPGPEFRLSAEIFGKVDFLVTNAMAHHLAVIVNIHHFDDFTSDPAGQKEKLYALWRQIAAHYQAFPKSVAFELLNEPKDAATTVVLNPIYAEVLRQIRLSNPDRAIFVGPGRWNQASELANLKLPEEDRNLIVTVHCYEPFFFTHQGASWTSGDVKMLAGLKFPGPPDKPFETNASMTLSAGARDWLRRYNTLPSDRNPSGPSAFRKNIDLARAWGEKNRRPMHMGEFGAYEKADPVSRANFYREFRRALDEAKMGWCVWDWKAGFKYWDDKAGAPAPGMREAIWAR